MKRKFTKEGLEIIAKLILVKQVTNEGITVEQINNDYMLISMSMGHNDGFFSAKITIQEYQALKRDYTINPK